jgi:hypothetical protein
MPNNNGGGNIYSSSFLFSVSFVIVVTFSLIYANIINSNTNNVSITDAYAKISSYKSQLDDTNIQGADINFISESSPQNMQSERSSDSAYIYIFLVHDNNYFSYPGIYLINHLVKIFFN